MRLGTRDYRKNIYIYEVKSGKMLILLFGFAGENRKGVVPLLTSVSGEGLNTARMILSSLPPSELVQVIGSKNEAALTAVKGFGLKTAPCILVDLKNKVKPMERYGRKCRRHQSLMER